MKTIHFFKGVNKWTALIGLLGVLAQACDDLNKDVIPPDEQLELATDVNIPLTTGSPAILNLLQAANLTGNATISIKKDPEKGTAVITKSALLKYIPDVDFTSGTDQVIYTVCVDGRCDDGIVEFRYEEPGHTCAVKTVTDKAVTQPGVQQPVMLSVLSNDDACQDVFAVGTLSIAETPDHGEASAGDGAIFYYPPADYEGSVLFVYSIATQGDPEKLYYGQVEIAVSSSGVVANNDLFDYTFQEYLNTLKPGYNSLDYSLEQILGNDNYGMLSIVDLEISITADPAHGTILYSPLELIRYTPGVDFAGDDSFTYQICYDGSCDEATVTIHVSDFGVGIVAVDDHNSFTRSMFELLMSETLDGLAIGFFYDNVLMNDYLNGLGMFDVDVELLTQPARGTVIYYPGEVFRYIPAEGLDFTGEDSFTYQICDQGVCSTGTIYITVN